MPPAALSICFTFLTLLPPACETWNAPLRDGARAHSSLKNTDNREVAAFTFHVRLFSEQRCPYLSSRSSYAFLGLESHNRSIVWNLLLRPLLNLQMVCVSIWNAPMSEFKDWGNLWLPLLTGVTCRFEKHRLIFIFSGHFFFFLSQHFYILSLSAFPRFSCQVWWSRGHWRAEKCLLRTEAAEALPVAEDRSPLAGALLHLEFQVYRGFTLQSWADL